LQIFTKNLIMFVQGENMETEKPKVGIVSVGDCRPTHQIRVENPLDTLLKVGDLVKLLVGPAKGGIGEVVVERNGNYVDCDPYARPDSIGVHVVERANIDPELVQTLGAIADLSEYSLFGTTIRWCGSSEQLELVLRPSVIPED
jgi:hypothetical protein